MCHQKIIVTNFWLFLVCNDVIKNLNQRPFLTKFLYHVNNPFLKGLDMHTNKCKSESCSKLRKSLYIAAAIASQPIFPYNIIENSSTSLALTLFLSVQITSNLVQGHVVWSYRLYQTLEQIYHNLHSHGFNDVICKPPPCVTSESRIFLFLAINNV